MEVINKIIITAEAVFDYEKALCLGEFNKRNLKEEAERYINLKNNSGRLLYENYFRCKYLDDESGQMLMLFLYRADRISVMQFWELKGICLAEDWDEDAECEGLVRAWLKTEITDLPDKNDWVVGCRVNKILNETDKTLWINVLEEVLSAFTNERDKETAEKLAFIQSVYFEFRERKRVKKKARCNRKIGAGS